MALKLVGTIVYAASATQNTHDNPKVELPQLLLNYVIQTPHALQRLSFDSLPQFPQFLFR